VTGIVIATAREAAPFLARAGIECAREPESPLICDLRPGRPLMLCICGMGSDRARAGAERLLNSAALTAVVNVGVAGGVGEDVQVGALYRISEIRRWPSPQTRYPCRADRWQDLPPAVVATVDEPVFDPIRRGEIARVADLVDMEGAAIASECQARGVPFYALKGVTDLAGQNDRERLLSNLDRLSAALAEAVWRELVEAAGERRGRA
jgi:adenosylhomocysteine nucleosidase